MKYKGKTIHPYESFYRNTTHQFFRGELGGIARCVKTDEKDGVPKIVEPMCSVHPLLHKLEFNPETSIKDIAPALRATDYKAPHVVYEPQVMTPKRTDFGKAIRKHYEQGDIKISRHDMTEIEPRQDGVSNTLTSVQKDNLVVEPQIAAMCGRNPDNPSERGRSNGRYKQRLEMNENGTSNTLTGVQKDNLVVEPRYRIRKLTPRECFRLMDVDDADIDKIQEAGISNSQQYKMAGNSIVVACLYHLFRKMFTEPQNEERQLTFW